MPDWVTEEKNVDYPAACAAMEAHVAAMLDGCADERIWLLQHPPIYTAGSSTRETDLLEARFPVYRSGRGGEYTYHGPGQRVAYVMLDLRQRGRDLRAYVHALEGWIIAVLGDFGVQGERRAGRIGIWVDLAPYGRSGEAKIAAIGVRVRKWISFHGVSVNLAPNLSHYQGIIPCGIRDAGVTSLADLGITADMVALDAAMRQHWPSIFETGSLQRRI